MSNKIEHYECPQCHTKFEITQKERMTTFIMHKPQEGNCPKCGRICFALDNFSGTGGGKF